MAQITPTIGSSGPLIQGVKKLNFRYGRSVSGASPSLDLSSGTDRKFEITINGDGPHSIELKSYQNLQDGNSISQAIEHAVQGVTAINPENNLAFRQFNCEFQEGLYVLISGLNGESSSVEVTDSGLDNVADDLKLGLSNGGSEDFFYPNETAYSTYVEIANTEPVSVKSIQLFTKPFDAITATYPSPTQEVYSSRIGGISGTIQEVATVNYTDATKEFLLNAFRV